MVEPLWGDNDPLEPNEALEERMGLMAIWGSFTLAAAAAGGCVVCIQFLGRLDQLVDGQKEISSLILCNSNLKLTQVLVIQRKVAHRSRLKIQLIM